MTEETKDREREKETMTIKQYLRSIRNEQKELWILKEKKDAIYYSLLPSGIRYDRDNVQKSPSDVMPDKIIRITELTGEIDKRIRTLERNKVEAMRLIYSLDDTRCRQILILYYLTQKERGRLMNWLDVAEMIGYSEDWVKHMHGKALLELNNVVASKDE